MLWVDLLVGVVLIGEQICIDGYCFLMMKNEKDYTGCIYYLTATPLLVLSSQMHACIPRRKEATGRDSCEPLTLRGN